MRAGSPHVREVVCNAAAVAHPVDVAAPPPAPTGVEPPTPKREMSSSVIACVTLTVLAGMGSSLQAFVNGRLGQHLGSVELAALYNTASGLVVLVTLAAITGVLRPGLRRLYGTRPRGGLRLRWWYVAPGACGAAFVLVSAASAPRVGVALLTVALVAGQTSGGLVVDRLGLSPAGRRGFTPPRLLGSALALIAVVVGAVDSSHDLAWGLLALGVLAGIAVAVQQAALGQLTRASGAPLASSVVNFGVGMMLLAVVSLATTGGSAPNGWSAPPLDWIGGALGSMIIIVLAAVVSTLGVLRVLLALVAGQSVGALIVDSVAPVSGEAVTARTVVTIALTLLAVVISGLRWRQISPMR